MTLKMYVGKRELTSRSFLTLTSTIQQQVIFRIGYVSHSARFTTLAEHLPFFYVSLPPNKRIAITIKQLTKMEATMEEVLQKQMLLAMNLKK